MLKKVLKWAALILGGLLVVLVLAFAVLVIRGNAEANKKYTPSVDEVPISTGAEAIQRGHHLAVIHMCTDCHTDNMSGTTYFTVPGMLTIPTPNLTPGAGGIGATFTNQDWVRAIRHGVGHDGRALMIMPSNQYFYLDDRDLGDLLAYLKSLPPVDNVLPERRIELMGRLLMAAGMFPPSAVDRIDHTTTPPAAPPAGVTAEYGQYLAHICTECHGEQLNGAPFGPPGEEVPTPNLTRGGELVGWSEADFINAMRTGTTPSGRQINADDMPWKSFGQMTDDELKAVWLYIQSLPPMEQGG